MNGALLGMLLWAIASVESNCDADAVSPNGRECGILQISEIMVRDCNRIVKEDRWDIEDRFDIAQSYEMAGVYFDEYCRGMTYGEMARCWNGGPRGHMKQCTADYSRRVMNLMRSRMAR